MDRSEAVWRFTGMTRVALDHIIWLAGRDSMKATERLEKIVAEVKRLREHEEAKIIGVAEETQ